MLETVTLDPKTLIIKSDNEEDLPEIINYISQKGKTNNINLFLKFASENRIIKKEYKFNRGDCYDR